MNAILMGLWFVLYGICAFVPIPQSGIILGVLAIVVGILVLAGR